MFCSRIKTKNPWGPEISILCGWDLIVSKVLKKGAYELIDFEGNKLPEPRNGLYLKKYYA